MTTFYTVTTYFWDLRMELASYNSSGAYIYEMAARFFTKFVDPCLKRMSESVVTNIGTCYIEE